MEIGEDCLRAVVVELEEALATLVTVHKHVVNLSAPVLNISRALERLEDLLPEEDSGPEQDVLAPPADIETAPTDQSD